MATYDTVEAPETRASSTAPSASAVSSNRWWVWLIAAIILVGGVWLYRSHASASGAAATVPGPGGPGGWPRAR